MRKAFAMFDTDRSGDIDRYELKQALRQLGMEADSAQTQGIIQKYDTTGRGKLDLAAFNRLVRVRVRVRVRFRVRVRVS